MHKLFLPFLLFAAPLAYADAIEDNSFLIEEAYNQEPGVVQFINTYQYSEVSKEWSYSFTNEIPIKDETHQFSYTVPVAKKSSPDKTGVGDIALNYRYQLVNKPDLAMAPRLSILLPTGEYKKRLGAGATGLQFNHAVSIKVNEKWVNHWNMGFTYVPDGKNVAGDSASLFNFNFGASAIYLWTEKTNFLCEFVVNNTEEVIAGSKRDNSTSYLVVPGFRTAFQSGDTEIVPGLAAILGIGPSAVNHERGAFAYLSIESKLW